MPAPSVPASSPQSLPQPEKTELSDLLKLIEAGLPTELVSKVEERVGPVGRRALQLQPPAQSAPRGVW